MDGSSPSLHPRRLRQIRQHRHQRQPRSGHHLARRFDDGTAQLCRAVYRSIITRSSPIPKPLTTSESVALDIIRVLASAVVAFAHLTQPFFSTRWPDLSFLAVLAVAVFFVLSGFVIRHVTTLRPATLPAYLGDRASRIYSIALPALLLTLLTDSLARHSNPAFYAFWDGTFLHPISRIALNLAFLGQVWNSSISPLSNSPYWSVNYEVAYYLLYGCFFYLAGARRWLFVACIALLFGPHVLFLMPLWIAGCLARDLYQRWNIAGTAARNLNRIFLALAILCAACLLPPVRAHVVPALDNLTYQGALSTEKIRLRPYLLGLLWTPVFLRLLLFARAIPVTPGTLFVRTVRFISEGTFPLYLLHFPLYVLIAACIPYNHASSVSKLLIFFAVLLGAILAGHPGNILKSRLRTWFVSPHFQARTPVPNPELSPNR